MPSLPSRPLLAEDPELLPRLHDLGLSLLAALVVAADALGQAVCSGLDRLGQPGEGRLWGDEEVRASGRCVRRLLDALDHIAKKIRCAVRAARAQTPSPTPSPRRCC